MEVLNILKEIYYKLFKTITDPKVFGYLLLIIIFAPIYHIAYPILLLIWWYNKRKLGWWNSNNDSSSGDSSKRDGEFWHRQPMNSQKYGLIKNPVNVFPNLDTMQLKSDETWWMLDIYDKEKIRDLKHFLNNNYQKDLVITSEYLQWLIQNKDGFVIGIWKNDKGLIGTIGGFPIEIIISNEVQRGYYIDILCVNKKYRKDGYAVKLMEKIIEKWRQSHSSIMLFKLDDINIGCPEDFKFNYYLIDKTKISSLTWSNSGDGQFQLQSVNHHNVKQAYQYFQKYMLRYPIHEQMTLSQFQNWILGNNILTESFLIKKSNKDYSQDADCNNDSDGNDDGDGDSDGRNQIVGFVNLMKSKYRLGEKSSGSDTVVPVIDIIYLLGNKSEVMPLILRKYRQCQHFITLDLADHQDIIQQFNAEQLYSTKYYLYNYELLGKFKNSDIGIHRF